jgi:hypothetical protein
MANDEIWRKLVETLDVPDEGTEAPQLEKIVPKKPVGRKFFVQKIVTEVYVYTDLQNHVFAESTHQDLFILGEMTEQKLNRLLSKRKKESS